MKKKFYFVLLFFFNTFSWMYAGSLQDNYKAEAIYIYSFTKYISWPEDDIGDQFVIGVYGYSPVSIELSAVTNGKLVGKKRISIKVVNTIEEIDNCQVLFISTEFENELPELVELANVKHILLITQGKDMTHKGAGINLVTIDGEQKFELNESIVKKAGLRISNQLLPLAILVN